MGQYDTQQVCLNGHQITASYHQSTQLRKAFCADCGEKTIFQCPSCKAEIQGRYNVRGALVVARTAVPSNCHACGAPYPWTERSAALAAAAQDCGPSDDALVLLRRVLDRFHVAVRQLRKRHAGRNTLDVTDEYDVQDLLHALLRLFFEDVRTEEWTPSYAGKSARMDFLLKESRTVIEVKMTRQGLGEKEVGTQLIDDIARYQSHPDCTRLICFVYDPEGRIANPKALESDLGRNEGELEIVVIIVPRGH